MSENKEYFLNEHGLRYWTNKTEPTLKAMQSYKWVDHVAIIDESYGREHVGQVDLTKFMEHQEHWHPMSKKEYKELLDGHKECVSCGSEVKECQCYDNDC